MTNKLGRKEYDISFQMERVFFFFKFICCVIELCSRLKNFVYNICSDCLKLFVEFLNSQKN